MHEPAKLIDGAIVLCLWMSCSRSREPGWPTTGVTAATATATAALVARTSASPAPLPAPSFSPRMPSPNINTLNTLAQIGRVGGHTQLQGEMQQSLAFQVSRRVQSASTQIAAGNASRGRGRRPASVFGNVGRAAQRQRIAPKPSLTTIRVQGSDTAPSLTLTADMSSSDVSGCRPRNPVCGFAGAARLWYVFVPENH